MTSLQAEPDDQKENDSGAESDKEAGMAGRGGCCPGVRQSEWSVGKRLSHAPHNLTLGRKKGATQQLAGEMKILANIFGK